MKYIKRHIPTTTDHNRRPGHALEAEYITIHNNANPDSTALNERGWLVNDSNKRTASWHIAVDKNNAVEAIPLDEVAWHAGDREGNMTSIGIEICEKDGRAAEKNAIELVARLLIERGWSIDRVRSHKSWSGKNCPRKILPRWNEFIREIEATVVNLATVQKPDSDLTHEYPNKAARRGDISKTVLIIQKRLRSKGYHIKADSMFGPNTERAVKTFQRNHGLAIDGLVGPNTWGKLFAINKKYTVKKGDTLWGISKKYNMNVEQIKEINSLDSDLIHVGDQLIVK